MNALDRDWSATAWWWVKLLLITVVVLPGTLRTAESLAAGVLAALITAFIGLWVWHRVWRALIGGLEAVSARL